ncbi:MAG: hypothetical protein A2328_10105 [Bdellovibrionales bacterium RIFOXYB2_FULL_36_6]|nr:MAG: hypothetical protein A2328_10105 [Bdellovibrionales bacterium RIFOXYB2_FULL_36_6]
MEQIIQIINIVQGLVIICATVFTSWWAYKTFAHKEKINELKGILSVVRDISFEIDLLMLYQDGKSTDHYVDLMKKLQELIFSSLYIKDKNREELKENINVIFESYRTLSFNDDQEKRKVAFEKFNEQYKEIVNKIHKISSKYV